MSNKNRSQFHALNALMTKILMSGAPSGIFQNSGPYAVVCCFTFCEPDFAMCRRCKYNFACLSGRPVNDDQRAREQCICFHNHDEFDFFYGGQHVLTLMRHKCLLMANYLNADVAQTDDRIKEILGVLRVYTHFKHFNLTDTRINEIINELHYYIHKTYPVCYL